MYYKVYFYFFLISFFFVNGFAQEQNSPDTNATLTSSPAPTPTTVNLATNTSTVSSCVEGYGTPLNCTKCAPNYENQNGQCLEKRNETKRSRGTGRRVFLILLACLLTVTLFLGMFVAYSRLNKNRRHRVPTNPVNPSDSSNSNPTIQNRFNNLLRSIGLNNLNKRGRFNFFSISNNNSSGQYRQQESARAPLNENPDEALLFDDPYADGGFNNSSANPYKSLTLAVT